MTEIGIWFGGVLAPVLSLLKIDGVGPFLALLIVFFGLVIAVIFTAKLMRYNSQVNKAINAIGEFEDEEGFAERFDEIDQFFSSRKGLSQCWREFTESIIYPHQARPGGEMPVIRNTSRPFDFFDAQSAGFTTPILRIFPNIFVGLGLVLTFAGLIAALTTAVEGMDGATEVMQRSLVDLLRTTSAKFYTSLMALGVSILLTLYFKAFEVRRDNLFKKLADKIERGMVYVSVEEVAYQQLIELKEQNLQLQQFNTDLAMKLGGHIKDAVTDAMSPVVDTLTDMGKNMGQNNIDAMKEIGETIAKNVQGAAGDSLGHLSDRLDGLTTVLGDMAANLTKSTGQFENDIANSLASMKTGMENLAQDLQSSASNTSEMLNEKLGDLANSLSAAANDIKSNLQEGAGQVSTELETAIAKLATATDSSAAKMSDAVSEIKNSVSSISTALENVSEEASTKAKEQMEAAGSSAADHFSSAGKSLSEALSGHIGGLSDALSGFEVSLGTASNNLQDMTTGLDKTTGSIRDVNSLLDKSAETISTASNEIGNVIKPALRASEAIQSSVNQMEKQVARSVDLIKDSVEKLEEEMRLNGEAWETHSSKFEGVNERLGSVFSTVNGQIEESQKRMADFVVKLDSTFTSAIGSLQDAVDDLAAERSDGKKS